MKTNSIPNQALPIKKKDENWKIESVEGYIKRANFRIGTNSYKKELIKMYDYYNGKTYSEDYEYILKPYGGKERKNFPAELRTYPLIKPAVDLLIGEKLKRPFNFTCIVTNSDVVTIKEEAKKEAILENMYQWFVNRLNDSGFETGMESEEVELPEHVEKIFERNWKDHRAIIAQNALEYLVPYLKWHEKHQKGFFDFLVSGWVFSHRGVYNNDPYYEILNPVEVDYDKDPDLDFVEDGGWVVIRQLASRSSVVDRFHDYLTDEDINQIQNPKKTNRDDFFWYNQEEQIFYDEWDDYTEVCSVYWKSLARIGFRTYEDEFGEVLEEVVDEGYEFNPETDINLEWSWVNEVWQGYRIDGDIFVDIRPHDVPRASIDNPSKVKLPVNGRAYSNRNSENTSFVKMGIPFQVSYDIFKYRLEAAISRSKDILALMDINLIPENWDMDKFMHIVEATGFAWVDYAKEGVQFNPQHQPVVDLSIKTIEQYISLLQYIRQEWEEISGVTRQRKGEMSQYEGKATSEQSIIQSSHITEDYFRKYNYFEERDLQATIDYSQVAWIDGKKTMYVLPDGTNKYLDVDDSYSHAEYGIFVTDSSKEVEKTNQIKQLGQVALEQGTRLSTVAEMIESESFVQLKDKIKEAEALAEEAEQRQQEFEQEMMEQEQQAKELDRNHERELKKMELNNKIELELIKQSIDNTSDEEWKQELEERRVSLEEEKAQIEKNLEERKLNEEERSNKAKEAVEKIKARRQNKSS